MAYFLDLFSPETYEAFKRSRMDVSGFRVRHKNAAGRVKIGDKLICYMTKLSRWFGILEVKSRPYQDSTPIFYSEDDPFIVRFKVHPIVVLEKEKAIPIHEDEIWNFLSFTKGQGKNTTTWTGKIRGSLVLLEQKDGLFLERKITEQEKGNLVFPIEEEEYRKLLRKTVRRLDKVVTVSVPEETDAVTEEIAPSESRESIRIQALLGRIGVKMGMKIWIPKRDRLAVLDEWKDIKAEILDVLPLNYDETTLKTIEQIDVLWLRGRAIRRAFEVEETTSIYSGILRMADLLALQPNMDIRLHIVVPYARREKVFQELKRPVFSLLEKGPLADMCTYISYDSLRELAEQKHLSHLSDTVLDDYAEEAE